MSYGADEVPIAGSVPRSPWEAFSTSPSPSANSPAPEDVPGSIESAVQLAPEVEIGNVEYKLKLLSPTPERFTRLVTQLKWRLLAGSGQALYEIGVSDSGQLVGLTRKDLDESLDTLERMAGELGATLIVQKEITIPSSPLSLNELNHGQVDGAPRAPRLTSPPAVLNADVPPLSLTDFEGSSSDDAVGFTSKSKPQRPNNAALAAGQSFLSSTTAVQSLTVPRSSPQPIIRDYPYGFNAWGYSRTSSSSQLSAASPPGTSASLPTFSEADSDVDDDAAFAFDLDISNFSSRSSASASNTIIIAEDGISGDVKQAQSQRLHRQIKHKKPKKLQPLPVDPAEKARQRRVRRESNRERRQPPFQGEEDIGVILQSGLGLALDAPANVLVTSQVSGDGKGKDNGDLSILGTPLSLSTQLTMSDDTSSEQLHFGKIPADNQDPSAPRLIAEALIVRKFTIEVEEPYLEFDKLRL